MTGDIWLFRNHGGRGIMGWLKRQLADTILWVRKGGHPNYNHVGIEDESGAVLEATGHGAVATHKAKELRSKQYSILIVRRALSPAQKMEMVYHMAVMKGAPYSYATLLAHIFGRGFARWVARRDPYDIVCSELVAKIYMRAIGYSWREWGTDRPVTTAECRPRDIEWSTRNWKVICLTGHGQLLKGNYPS